MVKGAGDLATGAALSLHHAGFEVIMTEIAQPTAIRLSVSFAQAVYAGSHAVEGVVGELCAAQSCRRALDAGRVAVIVDPGAEVCGRLSPDVVVDAIMAKRNTGTRHDGAAIVIGLGPGFTAGADGSADVDAVIETMRGHELGRIIRQGKARENTGVPGEVGGRTVERVLRAPAAGVVRNERRIGEIVKQGDTVSRVGGAPVVSQIDGCVRGLIHDGLSVEIGMKIGDVDPRGDTGAVEIVSDKARAIGRAVLEAALLIGRERGAFGLSLPIPLRRR